ncbi:MAG: tRNA pseudouridine(54/55) synthase Pus10 [Methanomicrobiales archaeon]|nr:tRNA pseudouridine(54/55) synthase Pus10 [Methanomicrobiales archaeon]
MDLMEEVGRILEYGPICDHCLGRFFGKRSHGLTNDERGRALRITHAIAVHQLYAQETRSCWICNDLFSKLSEWVERVQSALTGIEFSTFLVGTKVPPLIGESEELVWTDLSLTDPEPLKAEMNREVGKQVSRITGKEADFVHPDVVAILDIAAETIGIQINPLFVRGRYCKYERGIPQTRWLCRECKGTGCPRCNFTGKMYQYSVEELIGRHLAESYMAKDAILHGSGREDIDARMVGTGRPFIMELVSPRVRSVDLDVLANTINLEEEGKVSVSLEGYADRAAVETIKSKQSYKKYRILVEFDGRISQEELNDALNQLRGATIDQRTPRRVAHRRADLIRKRRVVDIALIGIENDRFIIDVVGEAGLYIKELVSGDERRTLPSLSAITGINARVVQIDVLHYSTPDMEHPCSLVKVERGAKNGTP